jgi:hypothetical protein
LILDGKDRGHRPVPGENRKPQGEDDRFVVFGEDAQFRREHPGTFYPSGIPLWVSDVLPGNVHDLAAARENVLGVLRPFCDAMPVLADPGYEGAGHGVHVPVKTAAGVKGLDIDTRVRNALIRSVRYVG